MRSRPLLFASALTLVAAPSFADPSKVREVAVASMRVHMGDVMSGLDKDTADIDLGPAPATSGSRIIDREEITRILRAHGAPETPAIPTVVRIVRKTHRLDASEIEQMVRSAITPKLGPGVTLTAVHPARSVDVPEGWTQVSADLPHPPRRTGPVSSTASMVLYENAQPLSMISVPIELALSAEAAIPDLLHGARVTLVVRRGLVEVSSGATAGADADIGNVVPVVLHPSGRTILARLEDKDHAIALDAP